MIKETYSKPSVFKHVDGDGYTKFFSPVYNFLTFISGWQHRIKKYALEGLSPTKLLDVGCGTGLLLNRAQEKGFDVTGIDASAGMLEKARQNYDLDESQLIHTLADDLPFADSSFDLVIACGSLVHIPEIKDAIKEMIRVAKPGALIRVVDHAVPEDKNIFTPLATLFSHVSGDILHDYPFYFSENCTLKERRTLGRGGYMQRFDFVKN